MSGYSRTERRCSDINPKITSSRLITVTKTGRRTEASESSIRSAPVRPVTRRLGRVVARHLDAVAVAQVLRALDDDPIALVEPGDDLDLAGAPLADAHLAAVSAIVRDDEHVRASALGDDRLFRHDERRHDVALEPDRHEHACAQQPLVVR